MVKMGDPLVIIDTAPYRAALAQADASLEQAEASATNAKVAANRNRELSKQSLVSRMQLTTPRLWSDPRRRKCPRPARRYRPRASISATPPSPRQSLAAPARCACSKVHWSGRARRRC